MNTILENTNLENTLENRTAERVHEILEDARYSPAKYARLVLSETYSTFFKPGSGIIGVKEALITTVKDNKTSVYRFVRGKSKYAIIAIMRNNKYIAFAVESENNNSKEYIFETSRKDRSPTPSSFSALLHTEIGTISVICDSRCEKFFYSEFCELSDEPQFYTAMLEMVKGVEANTFVGVRDNEQKEA